MGYNGTSNEPLVAIGVATYKRPRFLHDLLESMRSVELDHFRAHLIVADNDAAESARPIVESFFDAFPLSISYIVEPTRGIASARNRLVHEATKLGADYIAFVDDDALVEPSWLRELVTIALKMPVAAVVGVIGEYLFEPGVPDWVKSSNFWKSIGTEGTAAFGETGSPVRNFGTGNVLFNLDALKQIPGPFDVRCNLTGGSDFVLSECLYRRGLQAVRCAESIVYERVPASRATTSWMIRRGWRSGLIFGYVYREYETSTWNKVAFVGGAFARIAKHLGLVVISARHGRAGWVPSASRLASACGRLAGLSGVRYEEYRVTHGQ